MARLAKNRNNKLIASQLILILLIAFGILFSFETKANNRPEDTKLEIPKYDYKTLCYRYGKTIAAKIENGIVEYGFTKNMVFHAKGAPYLIEEPSGPMMDYEILHYPDMTIFIEYGSITVIKEHEAPKK